MTDETPAVPAASPASVVLDTNAQVSISRRPMYLAIAAVVAFAAFTVVWFAAQDDYEPGPAAKSFLAALADRDVAADPGDDELQCIDDSADGIDPSVFAESWFEVFGAANVDGTPKAFVVKVLDDCLSRSSRVALLSAGMGGDGSLSGEQEACLAEKVDDAVIERGGYAALMNIGESSELAGEMVSVILGSMGECDIDFEWMMDASEED